MRTGDLVKVMAYGNEVLVRRVVQVNGDVVAICTDEEYTAAQREGRGGAR